MKAFPVQQDSDNDQTGCVRLIICGRAIIARLCGVKQKEVRPLAFITDTCLFTLQELSAMKQKPRVCL